MLEQFVRLLAFSKGHHMSVEHLDLRHVVDDLQPVVRLFSQRVAEQIELLQERELPKKLQEVVEVSEPVVANQKDIQELELLDAGDVDQLVALAVDLLRAEVRAYALQAV